MRKLVLFEAFDLASSFEIEFLETDWPNVNLAHIGLLLRELVEPESKGCANAKNGCSLLTQKFIKKQVTLQNIWFLFAFRGCHIGSYD